MQSKLLSTLLLAGAAMASQFASASDGRITFNGNVTAHTCTISGNGSSSNNFTVSLPSVSASALSEAGATAGRTPFDIALTGCVPATGNVRVHFEQGSSVDTSTGNLKLETGGANNVQIRLLNSDLAPIKIGAAEASQNSKSVALSDAGTATVRLFAEYNATGAATPGAAKSSVTYTLTYQ